MGFGDTKHLLALFTAVIFGRNSIDMNDKSGFAPKFFSKKTFLIKPTVTIVTIVVTVQILRNHEAYMSHV